jgi:hypothetical protein
VKSTESNISSLACGVHANGGILRHELGGAKGRNIKGLKKELKQTETRLLAAIDVECASADPEAGEFRIDSVQALHTLASIYEGKYEVLSRQSGGSTSTDSFLKEYLHFCQTAIKVLTQVMRFHPLK